MIPYKFVVIPEFVRLHSPIGDIEDWAEERVPTQVFDKYINAIMKFYDWRRDTFPQFYRWVRNAIHHRDMMKQFGFVPTIGDEVIDCRGKKIKITWIDPDDPDHIRGHDGSACSLWHCCEPVT